jgi:hypothetical protein
MKNAVEMGSGPTISIGSGIQKLIEVIHMEIPISLPSFFFSKRGNQAKNIYYMV